MMQTIEDVDKAEEDSDEDCHFARNTLRRNQKADPRDDNKHAGREVEYSSLRFKTLYGHQIHIFEARVAETARKAILTWGALCSRPPPLLVITEFKVQVMTRKKVPVWTNVFNNNKKRCKIGQIWCEIG